MKARTVVIIGLTSLAMACSTAKPKVKPDIYYGGGTKTPSLVASLEATQKFLNNAVSILDERQARVYREGRVVVVKGDTLWDLSQRIYGDPFLWPLLCDRNGLKDCDSIEVGDILSFSPAELVPTMSDADRQAVLDKARNAHP